MKIKNGLITEVSNSDLRRLIATEDVDGLDQLLTLFGFSKTDLEQNCVASAADDSRTLAERLLEYALAYSGAVVPCHKTVGQQLVDHLSITTNIFGFLDLFLLRQEMTWLCPCYEYDLAPVSKKLLKALHYGRYSGRLAYKITKLSEPDFLALVQYVTSDRVSQLDRRYHRAFLRYIYEHDMLPPEIFFLYMRLSRDDPDPAMSLLVKLLT